MNQQIEEINMFNFYHLSGRMSQNGTAKWKKIKIGMKFVIIIIIIIITILFDFRGK